MILSHIPLRCFHKMPFWGDIVFLFEYFNILILFFLVAAVGVLLDVHPAHHVLLHLIGCGQRLLSDGG